MSKKNFNTVVQILNDAGFFLNVDHKRKIIYAMAQNPKFRMTPDVIKKHLPNWDVIVTIAPDTRIAMVLKIRES